MPSGHSVGALAWLLIALRARRRWVWVVTGLVAALIAVSRVYLGAHFPSQVLVGVCVGVVLLVAFVRIETVFLDRFLRLGLGQQLGLVALATTVLLAAGWLSVVSVGDGVVEAEWVTNAAGQVDESEPFDPADGNDVAATVGIFAGTAAGLVLLARAGGYDSAGSIGSRVLRFLVGFVAVVMALTIVGLLGGALGLDDGEGIGGVVWEFITTASTGLTVFLLAPLLFRRLGLTAASVSSQN